jgi:hypothetical protein
MTYRESSRRRKEEREREEHSPAVRERRSGFYKGGKGSLNRISVLDFLGLASG